MKRSLDYSKSLGLKNFKKYASRYGFKDSDYLTIIDIEGEAYKFVGFQTRSRKNICRVENISTKKNYLVPMEAVVKGIVSKLRFIPSKKIQIKYRKIEIV